MIKAIACEFPRQRQQPLSRYSTMDIVRVVKEDRGLIHLSSSMVWRILSQDALKPWRYQYWIFPRDPFFLEKAAPILDLYQGYWQGIVLGPKDFVISADEKTSIQARRRIHPCSPPGLGQAGRIESEYERQGAIQYLAALDIHRMKIFGRCEPKNNKAAFWRLVDDVMTCEPYASANRVFWIVDNGSSHRGKKAVKELKERYANLILIHTPVHASWLNQIEIYFSIVQRKVLTPNYYNNTHEIVENILAFQEYYMKNGKPFTWRFTRRDLEKLSQKWNIAA
jgi:hypothetical protein